MLHVCTDRRGSARAGITAAALALLLTGCASVSERSVDESVEVSDAARQEFAAALADMQAGHWMSAERRLRALEARHPGLPGPRVNLAIVLRELGEADSAQELLEETVREHPDFAPAHHQLALLLREQGRFEAADAAYAAALAADPEYALAHFNRAVLNDLYLARPSVALLHFERYQDMHGDEPDAEVARWIVELRRRVEADASLRVADSGGGA